MTDSRLSLWTVRRINEFVLFDSQRMRSLEIADFAALADLMLAALLLAAVFCPGASGHCVDTGNKRCIQETSGVVCLPFIFLGTNRPSLETSTMRRAISGLYHVPKECERLCRTRRAIES